MPKEMWHQLKLVAPYNSLSMHPQVEYAIMEAVLEHPEKTLAEIANNIYEQTGDEYSLSGVFRYFKRNNITRKKVCILFARHIFSRDYVLTPDTFLIHPM